MKKIFIFSCTFEKKAVILHPLNRNGYKYPIENHIKYHAKTKFVFCATL